MNVRVPDAWNTLFIVTWLADQGCVASVDEKIAQLFRQRRVIPPVLEAVDTAECIQMLGASQHWYLCITTIALLGELLLCVEQGGILPPKKS